MIFDTDILIWIQRGNQKAAHLVDLAKTRLISAQTYMELIQCAPSKRHITLTKQFLRDTGFKVLPLTENIGHRASIYLEEYSHSHGLRVGDAIIAATATEHAEALSTGNAKHFKPIRELTLKLFKP